MSINTTEMNSSSVPLVDFRSVWRPIVFGLFLFGQLLSIPCYLFMLYHILARKTARKALCNHAIVLILIFNLMSITTDLSMTMDFMRRGIVGSLTPALCLLHQYMTYGIWYGALFLMLWTSIERHILIFHSKLVATARGRLLFHYMPLVFSSLYAPILYFYLIVLYPCENVLVATNALCGGPCFFKEMPTWFIWYDSFVHFIIPIFLIIVFGVLLLVRVLAQKRRLQQTVTWHRNRKMIVQLILVSLSYLVFCLPYFIIILVQSLGFPSFGSNVIKAYIAQMTYVPMIVVPYATLATLSGLNQRLRSLITCRGNRRTIAPSIVHTRP
jgi:hypothetical protein